jgi:glycosyltransferase involved in cell wall biosynthesis
MRQVIMIGPSMTARGGVASVIKIYAQAGLFDTWPVRFLVSASEGSKIVKVKTAITALAQFAAMLLSGCDVVLHAHTGARSSFWRKFPFFLLAIIFRKPFIFHLHDGSFSDFYWKECNKTKKAFVTFVLRRAHCIVVLTPTWRKLITDIVDNLDLVVIANPVTIDQDESDKVVRDNLRIVYLGGAAKTKGIFDLLHACEAIVAEFPELKLICGGTGDMNEISSYAEKLGIAKNVQTIGWVEKEEKLHLLHSSSIYALPSYHEGLPMGLLEAMAAGLPVVATSVGGVPDLVSNGREGIIVKPGDVQALREALVTLLSFPVMATQMGAAGRQTVLSQYSSDQVMKVLQGLYRRFGIRPLMDSVGV